MRTRVKTAGFVIRTLDYGESDRIVSFYTEEHGKIRGIAKGARRSRKRFVNALDIFSFSTIRFSQGDRGGLAFIEGCDVTRHYPRIRGDLDKTLTASYLIELVDLFTVDGKRNTALFVLLRDFLDLIEESDPTEALLRFFEFRLLGLSGYEPLLEKCVACHRGIDGIVRPTFRLLDGGIRCEFCTVPGENDLTISPGTVKTLLFSRNMTVERLPRVAFPPPSLQESRRLLHGMIHHILGREIRSLSVLQSVSRILL
ncbi:MAG TPA: DNA repair protein RecO [Syntrophales bacterium]|nr:DNA repair protein RecO [Syntrophales bacterium]